MVFPGTISLPSALPFSASNGDMNDETANQNHPARSQDNQSHKGPGSAPDVPLDTTKGHRDDEKNNIREQGDHGNLTQNTSNRRSG